MIMGNTLRTPLTSLSGGEPYHLKFENGFVYVINECIGRGGSSLVYRATTTIDNQTKHVIIKEVFPQVEGYDGAFVRTKGNAGIIPGASFVGKRGNEYDSQKLMAILSTSKENVKQEQRIIGELQTFNADEERFPYIQSTFGNPIYENNTVYMVAEDLGLKSLPSEFDLLSALRYTLRILHPLEMLHGRDYLHLDIKPDNLLCARYGVEEYEAPIIFPIDLNSAKHKNVIKNLLPEQITTTTAYAAPELKAAFILGAGAFDTEKIKPYTDLYAVALTMLRFMSYGFVEESEFRCLTEKISDRLLKNGLLNKIPQLASDIETRYSPQVLKELNSFFAFALSPEQNERCNSCGKMREAINGILKITTGYSFFEYLNTQCQAQTNRTNALHYTYSGEDKFEYIFRKEEDSIISFLNSSGNRFGINGIDFSWWSISGDAGSGKSRFVYEVAKNLGNCWNVYFVSQHACEYLASSHAKTDNHQHITQWDYAGNILLVFDYAAMMSTNIGKFLSVLNRESTLNGGKLRLLFIERQGLKWQGAEKDFQIPIAGWYEQIVDSYSGTTGGSDFKDYCNVANKSSLMLEPITENDFRDYIRKLYPDEHLIHDIISTFESVDKSATSVGEKSKRRPLFLLMILTLLRNDKRCNLKNYGGYLDLLREIVGIEQRKTKKDFREQLKNATHEYPINTAYNDLLREVAFVTACIGKHSIYHLKQKYGLPDAYRIEPVEPDMLGEYYVLSAIDARLKFEIALKADKSLLLSSNQPFVLNVYDFVEQCFVEAKDNVHQFFIRCIQDFDVEIPGEDMTYAEKCVFDIVKKNCERIV